MKNRAKPALALALAIVGAVAAPLRSDARSGSCNCGESRQPLAKQAFRGACPQIFKNGSFDIESLTQEQKKRLKACLSPLARITFWSCSSPSTLKQQSALQMFANEMQLRIEAKDGLVSSGPDGTTLQKIVRKVVYLLKGMDEDKEWKMFAQ